MRQTKCFVMLAAAATLVACATQAPAPATIRAIPVIASAPTPTEKVTIPFGYQHVVLANGEERYCRNDVDTGSHVAHSKVCLTAAQLNASQNNSQDFISRLQAHGGLTAPDGSGTTPNVGMGH